MNSSEAYNTIEKTTYAILERVMGGSYWQAGATNSDIQMAAKLSAITDAITATDRSDREKAPRIAMDIDKADLRDVLSRKDGRDAPIGEFTEDEISRVFLAVSTVSADAVGR